MTTPSPTTHASAARPNPVGRLRRRAATLTAVAGVVGAAAFALPADGAGKLPNHGVDKKGFCTPKYIGNQDCFHQTETRYAPATCRKLAKELNYSGLAFCQILPPDGKGVIIVYSPACKLESQEDCRRRLGSKPYVMQPGHW